MLDKADGSGVTKAASDSSMRALVLPKSQISFLLVNGRTASGLEGLVVFVMPRHRLASWLPP